MSISLFFVCITAICVPGITLWLHAINGSKTAENWITGICFALSLAFCAVFLLAYLHLSYFFVLWSILVLFGLFIWVRRRDFMSFCFVPDASLKWVTAILCLAGIIRFLPVFFNEYPHGWDPYFHLLIIEKIIKTQMHVYDLMPFEDIPLNYPIGSHLFVATLSKLTNIASQTMFQLLIAFFSVMVCVQVFALLSVATGKRRDLALYGTATYSLAALMGSMDYYGWGGLPNLIGVYFFLGALTAVLEGKFEKKVRYGLPFLFAGICFSNHHTLGTTVVVFFILLSGFLVNKEKRERGLSLLFAGVTALIIALPGVIPKLFNEYSVDETGLLLYMEELHTLGFISENMGHGFFVATVLGFLAYVCLRKSIAVDRGYFVALCTLIFLFVLFEYVSRMITPAMYGRSIAPFTPGRFLTDAMPLLAFFPAVLFWKFQKMTGLSTKWVVCIIALLGVLNINTHKEYYVQEVKPAYKDAYTWIRKNTPESTYVLDEFIHAPFLTHRASFNTPIPSSELWGRARKRKLMQAIANRSIPAEAANAPVVYISPKINTAFRNTKVLWKHPAFELFILELYNGRKSERR